ncbi:MAG TPA: ABC transporter permease [Gemmatimonadaceae bacterium]|nr:ABC transporter permease [Gemmatimonadaceae bacterium]
MRLLDQIRENVGIAFDALRTSKLRSGLTILGVVIGVSTVMSMAAIVRGIQRQIVRTIEVAGPTTFYVMKVYSQTPLNPDALPKWVRVRPNLTKYEADRIAQLPEISYGAIWAQIIGRLEYQGQRSQPTQIIGADDRFTEIQGGDLIAGRWFTRAELTSGAPVAVVQENAARRLLGRENPIGKIIRLGGRPVEVIGLYVPPENIFAPPGAETGAIAPYLLIDHQFTVDKTNSLYIAVKPRPGVPVERAQEAVMVLMRELRHLRPADKNSFDFITQDQILDIFDKLTGAFFLVMIVLSSVGLMVGGIGVMAIMMVSVTDRTREIGVRKALGATRGDIMLQFLIEAATLTGIGGIVGIAIGLAMGGIVTKFMNVDAAPPATLTAVAVTVSIGIGIVFGLLPARRASLLDPVEALRYE